MTKFAGFDLNEVFREEEERRKNELEEQARRGREQTRTSKQPAPHQLPPESILSTTYNDVEFEQTAVREQGNVDKKQLFYFQDSLVRVCGAGFERHARPQEAFGLIIAGLEGKLTGSPKTAYEGMFKSYGEWLSLAFERRGDMLACYLDPEGLIWNSGNNTYVKQDFKYADKRDFNIAGKPSQRWFELKTFSDDFVQYVYGRSFNELPQEMKEGNSPARIGLPADGTAWPAGRGVGYGRYGTYGCNYTSRASRGVRSAQKNSTGNQGS